MTIDFPSWKPNRPYWPWIIVLVSLSVSSAYHLGPNLAGIVLALAVTILLWGVSHPLLQRLDLTRAPRWPTIMLLLTTAALAGTVYAKWINRAPTLYWAFDTDNYTWRPAQTFSAQAWGARRSVLQLHPAVGSTAVESAYGPWRASTDLDRLFPGSLKQLRLEFTQPEGATKERRARTPPTVSRHDEIDIVVEAERERVWSSLQRATIDPRLPGDKQRWLGVDLVLPGDVRRIRVSVTTPNPLIEDYLDHTVWLYVAGAQRADLPRPLLFLATLNDFAAGAILGSVSLFLLMTGLPLIVTQGWLFRPQAQTLGCCGRATAVLVSLAALAPTLACIFLGQSPFGGDQSVYGKATIDLFLAQSDSLGAWISAMTSSLKYKAPGIAWFGQVFVSTGVLLGSINVALLLSVASALLAALALVFGALWTLSRGNPWISAAGVLLVACAPLFSYLSRQYLVEPLQLLAVAWFAFILTKAPNWSAPFTLAHLTAAASTAMLAKASSPLYCVVPGALSAVVAIWTSKSQRRWEWRSAPTIIVGAFAVALLVGTVAWYGENISDVRNHVAAASSGPIAAVWGKEDTFLPSLAYWLRTSWTAFNQGDTSLLPGSLQLWSILLLSGILMARRKSVPADRYGTTCALAVLLQVGLVFAIFASNTNRESRYLLPIIPYFALMMGWAMVRLNQPLINIVTVALLAVQFASASVHDLARMDRSGANEAILLEIVQRTCRDLSGAPSNTIIAIDPTLRPDWLAPEPANYVASRQRLQSFPWHADVCAYGYLGDSFFGNTAENSWRNIVVHQPEFIVTVDPEVYPPSDTALNQALRPANFRSFFHQLRSSGLYAPLGSLHSDSGILLFGRLLPAGRILSDLGDHVKAISVLEQAARRDPTNVETWANLQLALLRSGDYQASLAIGHKVLTLSPNHYYGWVLSGAALEHLKQVDLAIHAYEQALPSAPSSSARRNNLEALARAHFMGNDVTEGCRYLREAANAGMGPDLQELLQQRGCR